MVKAKTLQVVWHSKEPVYSVDFHSNGQLVTGGADKEVKVWEVSRGGDGYASVRHVSSLTAHLSTVNCVRFSPTGNHLVSSGDGGEVLVWEPQEWGSGGGAPPRRALGDEAEGEALWRRCAALKGHGAQSDVMDVCWAPDGTALASAAIDNEVILFGWGAKRRGEHAGRFKNHKHFVQGVAWDPAQQFLVTQSADRTCRVYALKPPAGGRKNKVSQYLLPAGDTARDLYCAHTLSRRALAGGCTGAGAAADGGGGSKGQTQPLFADERVPTFFRRPAWSPDGSLLVVPAGVHKSSAEGRELNTAYVYGRGQWGSPVMHLPGHPKPVVVARFCPVLFGRDDGMAAQQQQQQQQQQAGEDAAEGGAGQAAAAHPIDLPYKMVLAVATLDSVVLYDTQSTVPLAVLGHLHYDSITDLAWSSDGQYLAVSSRDCYCSIAAFDDGELGTPLPVDTLPAHIAKRVAAAQRRAEPLQPPTAATPGPGRPSAKKAAAQAATASKLALTPVAQPAAAATPGAITPATAQPLPSAGQAHVRPADTAASPSCRKRIQPEALPTALAASKVAAGVRPTELPAAVAAAAQQQPAAKKQKRIVPQVVGPAPAVVGDSQQANAEPCSHREPLAPAAVEAPRRQVPEAVGSQAGSDAMPAAPAAGPKPVRRIVAESVGPPAPFSAAKSSLPAESAASGKTGAKRITPTPLRAAQATSQQFNGAASQQPAALPAPCELSRDGVPPPTGRRITPVPVGAAVALPPSEERTGTASAPRGIAALAAALGAAAASTRGKQQIEQLVELENEQELQDLLGERLQFGTAGLRGLMGPGYNRMNAVTVQQTTQGLLRYLQQREPEQLQAGGIVIGYDGRHNSREFARIVAACAVAAGVPAWLFSQLVPTPLVAAAVEQLGCAAGVMVTASHNPAAYNGYKVFWSNACQIIPPHDAGIAAAIEAELALWPLPPLDGPAYAHELVQDPLQLVSETYYARLKCQLCFRGAEANAAAPALAYTALHGVGTPWLLRAFSEFGLPAPVLVQQQCQPDPDFPTVSFPNPEEGEGAWRLAFQAAEEAGASLAFANDPDADRFAVAERDMQQPGAWTCFSGNEIGAMLAEWVLRNHCQRRRQSGQLAEEKLAFLASTVSSCMLGAIAAKEGVHFEQTLTGFKWLGNQAIKLEAKGYVVLFAFEEALGFAMGTIQRDKDGISAAAVFAELAADVYARGETLAQHWQALRQRYGAFEYRSGYFVADRPGLSQAVFARLRSAVPSSLGGHAVTAIRDLGTGVDTGQPDGQAVLPWQAGDLMITYSLGQDAMITVRASGTEPKLKYYLETFCRDASQSRQLADQLEAAVEQELVQPQAHGLKRPQA
ncbi:hypothetical protein D9Q98_000629 [Chlorella vulgaris]|uniref:phosphoglucomutase (alpha-D-glucose-1,6-bisphosphate-dependent) n=1 Tax=Chlorella vulgaris TaxID=3077 RepID=A0A9D4TYQ8_CHLVU|nr:hypothetical protein D9Q98_000629 [Chlorella vulgaris]